MEQTKATENLSQWFNLDEQKPWEPGVYAVKIDDEVSDLDKFSYWDGLDFCLCGFSAERAGMPIAIEGKTKNNITHWRGLASDPSAKPKPKARGNRRVTRYVVRSYDKQKVFASFVNIDNARVYADSINEQVRITKIRFRTPEAD